MAKVTSHTVLATWLLEQNTTHWVAYKQQTFISYSSGGCEVQDPGTSMLPFW